MRGLSIATKELIQYAYSLLEADHPQTLRQLHYAIFSRNEIQYDNSQADYKRLSRATTVARRTYRTWELRDGVDLRWFLDNIGGGIPGEWMIDETRQPERVNLWADRNEYVDSVRNSYRRDNWQDQPSYCEVWSEKATILGSIRPVAEKWGITLRVCHGFGSTGMEGQVGRCFEGIDKPITVFFLGDHDPSGHVIESDIHNRCQTASDTEFEMERLAIHAADISAFKLPPQKIKITDSRARFGTDAATVELDALPAAELRKRVDDAVSGLVNPEQWKRQTDIQEIELTCIAEFADRLKNLPQAEVRA
jgi:hypothetical protein